MGNVHISGHYQNVFEGVIASNGTTTLTEFDLANENALGLYGVFTTPGTLNFLVRPDNTPAYAKAILRDGAGAAIAVGVTGTTAISGEALKPLAPFRYVTVVCTPAQASGAVLQFITKA